MMLPIHCSSICLLYFSPIPQFCKILITKGIQYIEKLTVHGLLKDSEAEEIVEELEELLEHVISCNETHHEGEMDLNIDDEGKECVLLPETKNHEEAPIPMEEQTGGDDNANYGGIASSPVDVPQDDPEVDQIDEAQA